ncbi:MAG: glycosyltransferase family 2 protein [Bacteroidetes bacterium]|nr:glycosyltransferase family 2 protein [Bacteroidota bacterium]
MIYIVIPVHNRKEFTRKCLYSLQHQTVSGHRIIVVDDGSTDGTSEMLVKEFPEVIVLPGNGTLFWTAAINLGIRHALTNGAEYILTLNNDTVASEDFLEQMHFWASLTHDALLGALDVDMKTQKPYYGGEWVDWVWDDSRYLLDELRVEEQKGLQEVHLYPARGLLIPKIAFDKIGLFEEKKLPHYLADYDFTQMARRHGFKIYCNYDAKLYTYPEEGGDHKLRKKKNLRNYFLHLFGIRGGGNLKNFTIYTLRNCPKKYLPASLLTGYLRRLAGYWLK